MKRRSVARLAAGMVALGLMATGAALVTACLSPTLPLPPPSRPDVYAPDDEGNVRVTGVVQSRAVAYVQNTRTNQIVGEVTGYDGRYDLVIGGESGDLLYVWQSVDTVESGPTEVIVPEEDPIEDGTPPPETMGGAAAE